MSGVTEFIEGVSLVEYIHKNPRKDLLSLFQQIATTIDQLEKQHISHRDFHSENIIIQSQNDFKIIDFGASFIEGITPKVIPYNINFIEHLGVIPGIDLYTLIDQTLRGLLELGQTQDYIENVLPDIRMEQRLSMIGMTYPKFYQVAEIMIVHDLNIDLLDLTTVNDLSEIPELAQQLSLYTGQKVLEKLQTMEVRSHMRTGIRHAILAFIRALMGHPLTHEKIVKYLTAMIQRYEYALLDSEEEEEEVLRGKIRICQEMLAQIQKEKYDRSQCITYVKQLMKQYDVHYDQ